MSIEFVAKALMNFNNRYKDGQYIISHDQFKIEKFLIKYPRYKKHGTYSNADNTVTQEAESLLSSGMAVLIAVRPAQQAYEIYTTEW